MASNKSPADAESSSAADSSSPSSSSPSPSSSAEPSSVKDEKKSNVHVNESAVASSNNASADGHDKSWVVVEHHHSKASIDASPPSSQSSSSSLPSLSSVTSAMVSSHQGSDAGRRYRSAESYAKKVEQQTQRRNELTTEFQLMTAFVEKENIYWNKQIEKYEAMVSRLSLGERTTRDFHKYLMKSAKILVSLTEMLNDSNSFGSGENNTLNEACKSQEILKKTTASYLNELRERVFTHTIGQANTLMRAVNKKMTSVESIGGKAIKELKLERQKVVDAWKAYEKTIEERDRVESHDKPAGWSKYGDPYSSCRQYEHQLAALRAIETRFKKEMSALYLEVREEDSKRIDKTRQLLLDNLNAQKAVLEHTLKFTEQAIQAVKSVAKETDINEFSINSGLLVSRSEAERSGWNAESSVAPASSAKKDDKKKSTAVTQSTVSLPGIICFELPPPARDANLFARLYSHELFRDGVLFRQGRIIKSNWKEIYVVLTKSGFLHYFDIENKNNHAQPDFSIALYDCSIGKSSTQLSPYGIEIAQPKESLFLFSNTPNIYYFKAHSLGERDDWLAALAKFTSRTHEEGKAAAALAPNPTGPSPSTQPIGAGPLSAVRPSSASNASAPSSAPQRSGSSAAASPNRISSASNGESSRPASSSNASDNKIKSAANPESSPSIAEENNAKAEEND